MLPTSPSPLPTGTLWCAKYSNAPGEPSAVDLTPSVGRSLAVLLINCTNFDVCRQTKVKPGSPGTAAGAEPPCPTSLSATFTVSAKKNSKVQPSGAVLEADGID